MIKNSEKYKRANLSNPSPRLTTNPITAVMRSIISVSHPYQWHATLFVELESPKARYPTKAPTATDSITHPL